MLARVFYAPGQELMIVSFVRQGSTRTEKQQGVSVYSVMQACVHSVMGRTGISVKVVVVELGIRK